MSEESACTPRTGEDWFSPGRFALVLSVMVVLPFREALAGGQCFVARDFGIFSYPVASFLRESFWRGEWPLWNPLSCCGTPFLAQFNTLSLYPPSLIYLLFPLTWALPFFCLLHLYLGGLGMYFLAAQWSRSRLGGAVAGTIFAFNGLSLNLIMWPSHIATFALMPWVIWLAVGAWREGGRKVILAALAAAFQVLAGGPETILFTWLFLLTLAAAEFQERTAPRAALARRFLTVGLLALGLAAAQWLPFLDLCLCSNRGNGYGNSAWAMLPGGWANFLAPLFHTVPYEGMVTQDGQYWTSSYYAGPGAVFLAIMALWRRRGWRVWLPGIFLVLTLLLALGDSGRLFALGVWLLPFLSWFRYPVKFVLLTLLVLPLLAAEGAAFYQTWQPQSRRSWQPEMICGAAILALLATIVWLAAQTTGNYVPWREVAVNALQRAVFAVLIFAVVVLFVAYPARRNACALALLGLCWLDVLTHLPWQNPTVDASVYQPGLAMMKVDFQPRTPAAGESRLMLSPYAARTIYYRAFEDVKSGFLIDRVVFEGDCNLLDGVPKVDGFFSLYLRDVDKVLSLFDTHPAAELGPLEDMMAVSQTIAPGKVYDWVARPSPLPWVSAGQAPLFAGEAETLRALANTNSDFHQIVYLPPEAQSIVTAKREEKARVLGQHFGANEMTMEVESPGPAVVFISQAWYHHWRARVDGQPVTLWRANEAFQAVETPAGRHQIELAYVDRTFQWGGALSIISLAVSAGAWLWLGPRRTENHGDTTR